LIRGRGPEGDSLEQPLALHAPPPPRLAFLSQKDRVQNVEAVDENDPPLLLGKHGIDHGFDFSPAGPKLLELLELLALFESLELFLLLRSLEVLGLPISFGIRAVVVRVVH